jgi:hypothetical protein
MWGKSPSIIVRGKSPSILRPAALGVTAFVLVGAAATTAAWPTDGESGDAERPAAASEIPPVVEGLWPAIEAEYARAVEQGQVEESLRVLAYLNERARAAQGSSGGSCSGQLECIRQCESHGDYGAVSASGTYRGAYQFDQTTWEAVGGTGDPAAAPPAEQDLRAQILYEQSGSSPWPNCG